MEIIEFIGGPGLFLILGVMVIVVVLISKLRNRR